MKKMAAGEFKAKCLAVMDDVRSKRETVIITKRGKPIVKLIPITGGKDEIFGYMRGKISIKGDMVKPVLTLRQWGNLA